MKTSRRTFIAGAVQCGAGVGLTTTGAGRAQAASTDGEPDISYKIHPIGTVDKWKKQAD
jgi:hypothetical protein